MLGWISFWGYIIISVIIAILIIKYKKIIFADIMTAIMASLLSFSFDMVFCKQLYTYHYITKKYAGINSFLMGLTVFPSISLIFTSYMPRNKKLIPIYVFTWSTFLTIFEILVRPLGAVVYNEWRIVPYSFILYLLVFSFLIYYRRIMLKYSKNTSKQ